MPDIEQVVLAIVTGIGFGYVVHRAGSTPGRLTVLLIALWALQSGSQFLYRFFDGVAVGQEIITVSILRCSFALAALVALMLFNERAKTP